MFRWRKLPGKKTYFSLAGAPGAAQQYRRICICLYLPKALPGGAALAQKSYVPGTKKMLVAGNLDLPIRLQVAEPPTTSSSPASVVSFDGKI